MRRVLRCPPRLGLGQLRASAQPRPVLVGLHGPVGPMGIPLQTWGGCQQQPWADSAGRHAEPAPSLCVPVNPRLPPPSLSAYPDELGPKHWSDKRYENLMRLKQEALSYAREQRAHYILVGQEGHGGHRAYRAREESWPGGRPHTSSPCTVPPQYVDTDSILTNNQTLKFLVAQNKSVVAPMLDSQTFYSNFWCGITPQVRPRHPRGAAPLRAPRPFAISALCRRATTAGRPTTSPPRTGSAGAASPCPWCTAPS